MTNSAEIKVLIREQLPSILAEDASIRDFILRTVSDYYSPKKETDQKFEEFKNRVDPNYSAIGKNNLKNGMNKDGYGMNKDGYGMNNFNKIKKITGNGRNNVNKIEKL